MPPFCKAVVTQNLSQTSFEGSYTFELAMQGYASTDGMAFWVLDPDVPAPAGGGSGMGGFSAPTSYQDSGGTAGRIDLYETLSHASDPRALDPRIHLDPGSKSVVFQGAGRFSGSAGTYYTMQVHFEPMRARASCGAPSLLGRSLEASR